MCLFFFFKQKTAYEMRISDWSSDVCSSDLRGVDFEKQHEGRMPTVEQHVAIGLAYRVGHQFVAHRPPVYVEVLQVRLAARKSRQPDPTPQVQAIALHLDRQCLPQEARPAHRADPPRPGRNTLGTVPADRNSVV